MLPIFVIMAQALRMETWKRNGMRNAIIFVLSCGLYAAMAAELPGELSHLAGAFENEDAFVEALRKFDKSENTAFAKTRASAEILRMQDKREEADKMLAGVQRRKDLLRRAYEIGLQRYNSNGRLHNYYGELIYDGFGEYAAALKEWNLALSHDPNLSTAYNNLALHYFHNGMHERGLENLDKALELDKNNPDYLYNMAQMYLAYWPDIRKYREWDDKKIYKEAMKLSKKAVRYAPGDFSLLQDYAVNFYVAENFKVEAKWKDAAAAWRAARKQAGTPDEVFYTWLNEARAWIRHDAANKAEACLKTALELRPQSVVARQLLENLGQDPAR